MALRCQKQNMDQQLCQEVHWPHASEKDAPAPCSKVQPFLRFGPPLRASKIAGPDSAPITLDVLISHRLRYIANDTMYHVSQAQQRGTNKRAWSGLTFWGAAIAYAIPAAKQSTVKATAMMKRHDHCLA